jgi:hypothetical protein
MAVLSSYGFVLRVLLVLVLERVARVPVWISWLVLQPCGLLLLGFLLLVLA